MNKPVYLKIIPLLAALSSLLLQACGTPGIGGTSSTSDNDEAAAAATSVPLIIEANEALVDTDLPESGLNAIESISPRRISLVVLDETFNENPAGDIPEYTVVFGEQGGYEVQFRNNFQGQINLVAKVTFENDEFLYAPIDELANRRISNVVVSYYSHYVLEKLYEQINTAEQLRTHLPCPALDCSDQAFRKADLLNNLNATIKEYEVTFSDTTTKAEAMDIFEDNVDIKTHTENAIAEIVRSKNPIYQGTPRTNFSTDPELLECIASGTDTEAYNSVWFGVMLNDLLPNNGQNEVLFARTESQVVPAGTLSNSNPLYPILNQTTDISDFRHEYITVNNYVKRETLTVNALSEFTFDDSDTVRRFPSSTSDTYQSTASYTLYDRAYPLATPTSDNNIDRVFNPTYSKLYKANNYDCNEEPADFDRDPTWLISSNLGTANRYELALDGSNNLIQDNGDFVRAQLLESQNVFTWEIHSLETEPGFDESTTNGKEYGAVSYAVELSDVDPAITVHADIVYWDKSGGNMVEDQPDAHYRSYSIGRNVDGTRVALTEAATPISNNSRNFFTEATIKESDAVDTNYGRVGLDGGARASYGHITHDGRHMAFNLDRFDNELGQNSGKGILLATELRTVADKPDYDNATTDHQYELSGNIITLSDTQNRMVNINNSLLVIEDDTTEDCLATLTLAQRRVDHSLATNRVADQTDAGSSQVTSSACRLGNQASTPNGSEIELTFDNVNGTPMTLKGFVAQQGDGTSLTPGNVINLVWLQNDTLGLVFATRQQALAEGFE